MGISSFQFVGIQFSQHHLLKNVFFSPVCFGHLCQILGGCSCVHLCLGLLFFFFSICLHMSVLVSVPCHSYYYFFVIYLEVWSGNHSSIEFFAQEFFDYSWVFWVQNIL